jgi:hypothetical protein
MRALSQQPLVAIVQQLREAHPGWIVIWGEATERFEALACCFRPTNVWAFGWTPEELSERIRLAERSYPPVQPPTWAVLKPPPPIRKYRTKEDRNDHTRPSAL